MCAPDMRNSLLSCLDIIPSLTQLFHRAIFLLDRKRLENIQTRTQLYPSPISEDTIINMEWFYKGGNTWGKYSPRPIETLINGQGSICKSQTASQTPSKEDDWYWLWHRCVPSPQVHRLLCGACRRQTAAGELQYVGRVSPGSARRTHTPRNSYHGDCDKKQRLAPYSANKSTRDRGKR